MGGAGRIRHGTHGCYLWPAQAVATATAAVGVVLAAAVVLLAMLAPASAGASTWHMGGPFAGTPGVAWCVDDEGRSPSTGGLESRCLGETFTYDRVATRADTAGVLPVSDRGALATESITGARGPSSGRLFDADAAGGPVRSLDASRARINTRGTDLVESHLNRFAEGGQIAKPEAEMLGRLRSISNGDMPATIYDQNIYTHELREMVRYRQLGHRTGQPSGGAGYDLWNNTHTATLEDYGISDADLFFPGVGP